MTPSAAPVPANLAPKVLVTGASSFLGAWIVHTLLERGYRVRGSVNDLAKGQYIARIFAAHPGRFEFVVVPDISVEDAFLDALVGIDAVVHTAYPIVKDPKGHPNNVFGPVVRATVGILKTIVDFIPTVKRVIITSSVAAAEEPRAQPFTYTGDLWNDFAVKHCEQNGVGSNPTLKYIASKTLAERAAWDYVHNNADLVHFDLVSILPGYILGPSLHPVSTPDSLQFSTRMMMDALVNPKNGEDLMNPVGAWIDVRDLAIIHASALTSTSVVGKRIVACAGSFNWQDMYDALNSVSLPGVPVGHPNSSRKPKHAYKSDIALSLMQARRFKTLADTARDTVVAARKVKDGVHPGFTWDLRLAPNGGGASQGSGLKNLTFESLEGGFSPSRFSFP